MLDTNITITTTTDANSAETTTAAANTSVAATTTAATVEADTAEATTTVETSYYGTAGDAVGNVRYDPFAPGQICAQWGLEDIETIKPRSRDQYVALFKKSEERTALATLRMCRVVYEAQQTLEEHEFADFCAAVGYKDDSAVIRKFCAIGKLQPRLVNNAARMPHEWTKIYTLTQMPAQFFESYVKDGMDFRGLTGKQLKALVDATRPEMKQLSLLLPKDKDSNNFVFAKLLFNKTFVDAYDWRAVKKALAEIESRLPIKVQFDARADNAYAHTVKYRYAKAKNNAKDVEFKPAMWDYGTEAAQDNLKSNAAEVNTIEGTTTPTVAITK